MTVATSTIHPRPMLGGTEPNTVLSLPERAYDHALSGRSRAALLGSDPLDVLDHLDTLRDDPAGIVDGWPLARTVERSELVPWLHRWWLVASPTCLDVRTGVPIGRQGWGYVTRARIPWTREDVAQLLREVIASPDSASPVAGDTVAQWTGVHPTLERGGPVALYWGEGDWTCSVGCAARAFFGFDRLEAMTFWDSELANCYSVHLEQVTPLARHAPLAMHDLELVSWAPGWDWLAPGTPCHGCGRILRPLDGRVWSSA